MDVSTYDPQKRHRRSMRLKEYDYSQPGAYFVTICTHHREPMFGEIVDKGMELNEYGEVVLEYWQDLPVHHPYVRLDSFIVMPNHVHGIVVIRNIAVALGQIKQRPLSEIVRVFKTTSSRRINKLRDTTGIPVWQRSYWEHVIRNESAFDRIRNYIITNPLRWHLDRENPERIGKDDFDVWLNRM